MKIILAILFFTTITLASDQIRVLEIDSGVDLTHPEVREHVNISNWNGNTDYLDQQGHGTHIAGIILKDTCQQVELTSCKYYDVDNNNKQNIDNTIKCFKRAITEHFDIINYSSGGPDPSPLELDVLKQIKTTIVVAAGNNNADLNIQHYYPASYGLSNIIIVGNLDGYKRNESSSFGLINMVWEEGTRIYSFFPGGRYGIMTGTSQAAAFRTNRILRGMCEKK